MALTTPEDRAKRRVLGGRVQARDLHVQSYVASGKEADVYEALWVRMENNMQQSTKVAVKRLHSTEVLHRDREAVLGLIEHENLVKCYDFTAEPPYLIVEEFCAGGNLSDLLYNSDVRLTWRQKLSILRDVASAVKCLHNHPLRILHRDLKSSNVLLVQAGSDIDEQSEVVAKVADMGLSKALAGDSVHVTYRHSAESVNMTLCVGTWRWMAPEIMLGDGSPDSYDGKVDVFSFGMLMYEVLERKMPFSDMSSSQCAPGCDPRIVLHMCEGGRPEIGGELRTRIPEAVVLMERCWADQPSGRPDFGVIFDELQAILKSPNLESE